MARLIYEKRVSSYFLKTTFVQIFVIVKLPSPKSPKGDEENTKFSLPHRKAKHENLFESPVGLRMCVLYARFAALSNPTEIRNRTLNNK